MKSSSIADFYSEIRFDGVLVSLCLNLLSKVTVGIPEKECQELANFSGQHSFENRNSLKTQEKLCLCAEFTAKNGFREAL